MSELKTLKDIKGIYSNGNNQLGEKHIHFYDLRSEAIKWVKSNDPLLNDCDGAVDDWIKHFFNLREEELK